LIASELANAILEGTAERKREKSEEENKVVEAPKEVPAEA
jgi:hypothetical protein